MAIITTALARTSNVIIILIIGIADRVSFLKPNLAGAAAGAASYVCAVAAALEACQQGPGTRVWRTR